MNTKPISPRTRMTRLKKLRNTIALLPRKKLNLREFMHANLRTKIGKKVARNEPVRVKDLLRKDCGTRCCVAGWAVLLFANPNTKINSDGVDGMAQHLLGLSRTTANALFYLDWPNRDLSKAPSREEAVGALDLLIANNGDSIYPPLTYPTATDTAGL